MPEIQSNLSTLTLGSSTLVFSSIDAKIAAQNKWSETSVHSYGGGGHINTHGGYTSGYISAPTIVSSQKTKQEIFFELENGKQICLDLTNHDVKAAPGHDVTLLDVTAGNDFQTVALVNRTMDIGTPILDPASYVQKFVSKPSKWITFIGVIVIYAASSSFITALKQNYERRAPVEAAVVEEPPKKATKSTAKAAKEKEKERIEAQKKQEAQKKDEFPGIIPLLIAFTPLIFSLIFIFVRLRLGKDYRSAVDMFSRHRDSIIRELINPTNNLANENPHPNPGSHPHPYAQ